MWQIMFLGAPLRAPGMVRKKVLLRPGEDVLRASSDWILGKMAARLVCAKCTTSSILEVAIAAMGR